jgi:hypothetical protein
MTIDPVALAVAVGTGLGACAAGIGIYRFGTSRGHAQTKALQAMDVFIATQTRVAESLERTARAAEEHSKMVPLFESLHEERLGLGMTLRAMSRKLNTIMRINEDPTDEQGS